MVCIKQLSASVEDKPIIHDFSLQIKSGEIHALMGPNGSGKSTLAHVLMGYPATVVTQGEIWFNQINMTSATPDVRARAGMFLAVQHPHAIPGVRISSLLKEAGRAVHASSFSLDVFLAEIKHYCALLALDQAILDRSIHDGFSGGERKKLEILQLLLLKPSFAVLDEIDSGLDIDALAIIGKAISYARTVQPHMTIFVITHYQRILSHIVPDYVHIMAYGRLVQSGSSSLAQTIEQRGYDGYY